MNFWEILGISPTANVREIKKAYSQKVKECHSEDAPEEWKQLHNAYKRALAYANGSNIKSNTVVFKDFDSKPSTEKVFKDFDSKPSEEKVFETMDTKLTWGEQSSSQYDSKYEYHGTNIFENLEGIDTLSPIKNWNEKEVEKKLLKILGKKNIKNCADEFREYMNSADIKSLYYTPQFWLCLDRNFRKANLSTPKAVKLAPVIRRIYDEIEELMARDSREALKKCVDYAESFHFEEIVKTKQDRKAWVIVILSVIIFGTIIYSETAGRSKEETNQEIWDGNKIISQEAQDFIVSVNTEQGYRAALLLLIEERDSDYYKDHADFNFITLKDGTSGYRLANLSDPNYSGAIIKIQEDKSVLSDNTALFDNTMMDKLISDISTYKRPEISELLGTDDWTLKIELSDMERKLGWMDQIGESIYSVCQWDSIEDFAKKEIENRKFLDSENYKAEESHGSLGNIIIYLPDTTVYTEDELVDLRTKFDELSEFYKYYDITFRDAKVLEN